MTNPERDAINTKFDAMLASALAEYTHAVTDYDQRRKAIAQADAQARDAYNRAVTAYSQQKTAIAQERQQALAELRERREQAVTATREQRAGIKRIDAALAQVDAGNQAKRQLDEALAAAKKRLNFYNPVTATRGPTDRQLATHAETYERAVARAQKRYDSTIAKIALDTSSTKC